MEDQELLDACAEFLGPVDDCPGSDQVAWVEGRWAQAGALIPVLAQAVCFSVWSCVSMCTYV